MADLLGTLGNSATLTLSVLVATFILVLGIKQRLMRNKIPPHPPGPLNWPIVGSMFLLRLPRHRSLEKLAKKYGPIMYMRLGSLSTVVVSSAEMAKQFLMTHDAKFSFRPPLMVGEHLSFDHNDVLFTSGERNRLLRKIVVSELLGTPQLRTFKNVREEEVGSVITCVWPSQSSYSKSVTMRLLLRPFLTNIISRTIFGQRFFDSTGKPSPDHEGLQDLILHGGEALGKPNIGDVLPWLRPLDLQGLAKEFKCLRVQLEQTMSAMLEEHKREKLADPSKPQCLIDVLLALDGESKLSDRVILAVIWDLFLGSTDTSSSAGEWAFAFLLRHPHTMAKAHEELDRVVGNARRVEESDLPNLPYILAVAKESQRLRPVVPLPFPHYNEKEAIVAGFRIPAGTQLILNAWAIMRDPDSWDNPLEFRPERFLEQNISPYGQDFRYLPFSAGRRGCPGAVLGMTTTTLSLASLLHAFDWKLQAGQLPQDVDLTEENLLIVGMRTPLVAVATPRIPSNVYLKS